MLFIKKYIKLSIILVSTFILSLILWNAYLLSQTFKNEERQKMEIWAEAYKMLNTANENTDLSLCFKILSKNKTIPIILTDTTETIVDIANVDDETLENKELQEELLSKLKSDDRKISILHPNGRFNIYYGNSLLFDQLKYYPLTLVAILILFGALIYAYFKTMKTSTENKLWASMAKETAHQIGTPLSSLMGWVEIMKMENMDQNIADEIQKDINRLQIITDRFSKIGSSPTLSVINVVEETRSSFEYLKDRSSKQIIFRFIDYTSMPIYTKVNKNLHNWSIENIVKNAIDAIKGKGEIIVSISNTDKCVNIRIADTGKGIPKKNQHRVFEAGFTTKKRGWGLGLSLTKRIVEDYHKGKIKIERSVIDKGTTFCITLNIIPQRPNPLDNAFAL